MTRFACLAALLTAAPALCLPRPAYADDLPAPMGPGIVDPGAKLEHLFTRTLPIEGGLTEGPVAAPDGAIYFTDIPFGKDAGKIMRFDPQTGKTTVWVEDSRKANGLELDLTGNIVACEGADYGGRAVARYELLGGKRTVLSDNYMGKKFNAPNDLVVDHKNRIYFTDPKYLGHEPRELEHRAVYRVDGPGKTIEITHDVEKPNGIALSPDMKTLYVADHNNGSDDLDAPAQKGAMKIYAFPLNADGLVAGERKTIYDFGSENGCDGMCVDVKGNIYLTARSLKRPGVLVINPEGKEVAFIPTGLPQDEATKEPKGLPSNVTFGWGTESHVLYITIDKGLYRIPLKVQGFRPKLSR